LLIMPDPLLDTVASPEGFVDAAAALLALTLDPEHRPGVISSFERLQATAGPLMAFALPEDLDEAPVFAP
jgi:hypothetical protein